MCHPCELALLNKVIIKSERNGDSRTIEVASFKNPDSVRLNNFGIY